jgi:hypothetical protein
MAKKKQAEDSDSETSHADSFPEWPATTWYTRHQKGKSADYGESLARSSIEGGSEKPHGTPPVDLGTEILVNKQPSQLVKEVQGRSPYQAPRSTSPPPRLMDEHQHSRKPEMGLCRSSRTSGSDATCQQSATGTSTSDEFVMGFPLACLVAGLMLAVFLISLDRTIVSTVSRSP